MSLVLWYEGLCNTVDQDGVRRDYVWNVNHWRKYIDDDLINEEQIDLMHLTYLRSRTAMGEGGRWQALTFERRVKIILGVGSVGGRKDGD